MIILDKSTTHIGIVALTAREKKRGNNDNRLRIKTINEFSASDYKSSLKKKNDNKNLMTTLRLAKPLKAKLDSVFRELSHVCYRVYPDDWHMSKRVFFKGTFPLYT